MKSVKKNFIYNLLYQFLILIVPLITSPYLARVIGAEGVGIYSYTYSVVYYFMLITLLGVNNYGNRSIAQVRDDPNKLNKTFWSIYAMQFILGIFMLIMYLLYVFVLDVPYKMIVILEIPFIISSILDINWFFFGIEDFKSTITRNTIVKIGSLVLIYLLVKNTTDLWKYVLIMSSLTLLSQLIMWSFLRKKIKFCKVKFDDIKIHIKPNLILFLPVIAVSIYKVMDKVMLGGLSLVSEVGFYENAEKIISVPIALIASLGTVMLPRMSNVLAKGEEEKAKEYIFKSIKFIMFLAYPICCGLIVIGYNFAPIFFGSDFQKTGILIMLLALTLPVLSFANVLRTQYLIPKGKDRIFLVSSIYGAIVNLFFNSLLIGKFASIGACIGTIVAETVVMIYQSYKLKDELPIIKYFQSTFGFLVKSIFMLIIIYPLNYLNIDKIAIIMIQVIAGSIVYFVLNINYIFEILNFKRILKKFLK